MGDVMPLSQNASHRLKDHRTPHLIRFLKEAGLLLEDPVFLGYFWVSEFVALRACCKVTAHLISNDLLNKQIRIGNLDMPLKLNFWILQAPFFE